MQEDAGKVVMSLRIANLIMVVYAALSVFSPEEPTNFLASFVAL